MLALVLILGGGYLAGARRQPGWPVARRIWFLGLGLGFLVVATMSWVGVYQPVLFYARAVQTVLTFLALMASCFAFFWTLLRVDPVPKEYSYAVSMWITGAEVIGDAFLGLAIIASQNLIGAAWYHALARPWGPTPPSDQIIGGGAGRRKTLVGR
jgi:cytochrome c oxidase assembly factor CtaG